MIHSISNFKYFALFVHHIDDEPQLVYVDAGDITSPSCYNKTEFQDQDLRLVACNSGMVCCMLDSDSGYYFAVGNPIIEKEFIPLTTLELQVLDFGFFFDPITQNFKILVKFNADIDPDTHCSIAFIMFDSSIGRWRSPRNLKQIQLYDLSLSVCIGTDCYGVSLDRQSTRILTSFDMVREECKTVHTPVRLEDDCFYTIHERDGSLCLIQVTRHVQARARIWILYEDMEWMPVVTADLKQLGLNKLAQLGLGLNDFFLSPEIWIGDTLFLGVHVTDEVLLRSSRSWNLHVDYDIKSGQLGKMVTDVDIRSVVMYQPSIFTCKMEKNGICNFQYFSLFIHYINDDPQLVYADADGITCPSSYNKMKFQHQDLRWLACNNGIVCCMLDSDRGYYFAVGNPITEKVFIPLKKFKPQVLDFGFFFDPITQNFKILVKLNADMDPNTHCSRVYIIFDSSIWRWKAPRKKKQIQRYDLSMSVCIGTNCYGVSLDRNQRRVLTSFDMVSEECRTIHTPVTLVDDCSYKIQERDGGLCLIQVARDEQALTQIWVSFEETEWVPMMKANLMHLGLNNLEKLGLGFNEFSLYPELWIGDTLFLGVCVTEEVLLRSSRSWNLHVDYDIKSGQLGKMVTDADIGCIVMYQPTLFTCKMEKRQKLR
ncbi:hypothetical protein AMTR_s00071p00035430 [Amborella trichopoda]|uniref:F-box associated beta-propeller type 3 domain-containing protein n=2 Tax=Amborella trichopoda TaxID=13333 RepID=U5DEK6_AMBTC|nr:hypothetical protein AMTR_s00071p00035430 [Amborella trichopoda]